MKKKCSRQITIADLEPHVHNFQPYENKVEKIYNWLSNWIILSLECGKISYNDTLPSKAELAFHIGVSQGTLQTVFRKLEDSGLVESKQKLGTFIKDKNKKSASKLTSKREITIEILKKYLLENNYKINDQIPSIRKISKEIGITNTTLRTAVLYLCEKNILNKKEKIFFINNLDYNIQNFESNTLAEKIALNIKEYIDNNLKHADKLPSNKELVNKYNVSMKTIHDAIKILSKQGLIYTRRGKYGTIVNKNNDVQSNFVYNYEKIEQKIKSYITKNCQLGDKIPSIKKLASEYETSEKTIKKALDNLAEDGYLAFSRGRYGGTYVLDIPQNEGESYKWLAINNDYFFNQ